MKRKILFILSAMICMAVAFWPSQSAHSNGSGAAAGYTGSPNEFSGRTCSAGGSCHSGGTTAQTGWVTSTVPACGYTPGQTYSVTVFVTSPGRTKFGFSASPQKPNATLAGTLIAGTGMQINGSGKYITHTSAGTTQTGTNSRTWTFQWTAPASGTGTITFYAAMNATNSSNTSAGDMIYSSNLVIPEAPATLAISNSGSTTYCQSSPVTLSSNISGGNDWKLDGVSVGSQNSVVASGSGTYLLTNTTGACVQTASVVLTSVASAPVVSDIVVGSQGSTLCEGQSTTLTATGSGVTWQPGGQSTNSITVSSANTYTYSLTNVCGTSTSNPVSVIVNPLPSTPVITTDGDVTQACEGQTIGLNASNISGIEQATWQPGALTGNSIQASQTGTYSVVYSNGCGNSSSVSVDLQFNPIPQTPSIFVNVDLDLEATIDGSSYEWYLNGTLIDGVIDQVLTPTGPGLYSVKVISGDGCNSAISAEFEVLALGIAHNKSTDGIRCFPNPSAGIVQISVSGNQHGAHFQLFDCTGKLVKSFVCRNNSSQTIDLNSPSGLYFLRSENWSSTLVIE